MRARVGALCLAAAVLLGRQAWADEYYISKLETPDLRLLYYDPIQTYLTPYVGRAFENSFAFQRKTFDWTPWDKTTVYLRDLSEKTAAELLEFERMPEMTEEEVIAHLTQVKGVGVWTAHMFLMFTLHRPDILPTGDYGVQAAIKKHYKKRKWPKPAVMEKIAKPWSPYRSIACWYLWRSLDIKTVEK